MRGVAVAVLVKTEQRPRYGLDGDGDTEGRRRTDGRLGLTA